MKLRTLIFGGSGQLGTELRLQAEDSWEITAPSRTALDMADAAGAAALVRELRPNLVVNASALHLVDVCEADFARALAINAVAVSAIAKASAEIGARFVTVSTDYVFDGKSRRPYRETDLAEPIQCYGISKLAGERAALAAHPEGAFVIRTCGLYGSAPSRQKGNFVVNRLADARRLDRIEVGSDLTCTPTSAADLATATIQLLTSGAPPGLYHLTNAGSCDWARFTAEIFQLAGVSTRVVPVDRRGAYAPVRPAYTVLDCGTAAAHGVSLRPWQDALAEYVGALVSRTR
ncbi:dTDP-4-dehydrorhamnose reductase [Enterovirga sp.]|jgi:dTDP-4-dehydrorhamnose reductase|uniref:dTDP-4-dehydrorhamnose reductase n=1 Tax=Enterovirga sp. TaxID=2026350 RepID=UPI00261796F7|nr:dTDP-4-dehydrorhamnose reductase [Enterovirga sp.]MDB5589613.1 dTDP-4-dehydrorhamnose reductase [Enterovirga sp.]